MRPRTRNLLLAVAGIVLVAVLVAVVVLVRVIAEPSSASHRLGVREPTASASPSPGAAPTAPPRPEGPVGNYVALGDSFAAGVGGEREQGSCKHSPFSYPTLLSQVVGVNLVADVSCIGATTADVMKSQLYPLGDDTKLVTLSIGGNDVDVAEVASACSNGSNPACTVTVTTALRLLQGLPARLTATYRAVARAAPNARIVVTGYPELFLDTRTQQPDFSNAAIFNAAAKSLNDDITKAVDAERASGMDIQFVGVDFSGHGVGSTDSWIVTSGRYAYHATAAGYAVYARDVEKAIGVE